MDDNLRIAAIGGSAGALAALQMLFEAATGAAETGPAFVVLVHQSRDRESTLHSLLAQWSGLHAEIARAGAVPARGRIYVAPPGQYLELHDGAFQVTEAPALRAAHPELVDRFFTSMAAQLGSRSAAVVLSGAGHDGTAGAAAVRAAGGRVLVQDPATAAQESMPGSVLRRGLADAQLSPVDMLPALSAWARSEATPAASDGSETPASAAFEAILALVRRHSGNDLAGYKPTTLRRRIERRAGLSHCADFSSYLALLRDNTAELDRLAKDMFVGVTSFFRDEEAFALLEAQALPMLLDGRSAGQPLRAWIAGCSTGEEAYSVAILMHDAFAARDEPAQLQIFATDIDEAALDAARAGRYAPGALQPVSPQRLARYFVETPEGYVVTKALRESIVFASHNLISDPPFSRLDLMVCRNVLIYLNAETQKKLLKLFHFILNPGGVLFLGSSESVGPEAEHFEPLSKQWRLFRHTDREIERRPPPLLVTGSTAPRRAIGGGEIAADIGSLAGQERVYRRLIAQCGPTLVLVNERLEILYVSGDVSRFLAYPAGEPTRDLARVVRAEMRVALRSAVSRALREGVKASVSAAVRDEVEAEERGLRITATPVPTPAEQALLLVSFEVEPDVSNVLPLAGAGGEDWLLQQMEQELNATREDLQGTIERMRVSNEEVKAANEEIMAMNEELQSSNEELESSKEELQSVNEELATANAALDAKVLELERTNADLHNLLLSSDTATLFLDAELRIRRFTAACTKLMRVIPGDVGSPIADIVQTVGNHDLIDASRQVLAGQPVAGREVQADDGHWYLRRILPYRAQDGAVRGVVLTFPDVSAIKEGEAELARRNEQLEWQAELLQEAPVLARDMADRIIFWNPGAEALYGWTAAEAIGQPSHELLRSRFERPLAEIKAQLASSGGWSGRITHARRDGSDIVVDSRWTLRRDNTGKSAAIVEVNNDVTARVAAEAQLAEHREHLEELVRKRTADLLQARQAAESANHAKGQFLSHMSHELRTPLNAVLGFAQLLVGAEADELPPPRREQAEHILAATEHLLHLLNDVVDLARVDAGELIIDSRAVALAPALSAVVSTMAALAARRRVQLVAEPVDEGLTALCDPVRLHEVLINLVSNAIKYNVDGGRVTLRSRGFTGEGDRRWASIEVEDTGRGLTARKMQQLFQPFNRLGAERTAVEGTGIGLAITRQLVERMGGHIEVSSTPGRGSLFRVVLPVDSPAASGRGSPEAAAHLPSAGEAAAPPASFTALTGIPLRVLCVEDHPMNAEFVRQMLANRGDVRMSTAASGMAAIDAVRRERPDVLLVDMNLGDMTGNGLLEKLGAEGLLQGTHCLAVSADVLPEQILAARGAGFHGYLTKPLRVRPLFDALDRALAARGGGEPPPAQPPARSRRARKSSRS